MAWSRTDRVRSLGKTGKAEIGDLSDHGHHGDGFPTMYGHPLAAAVTVAASSPLTGGPALVVIMVAAGTLISGLLLYRTARSQKRDRT
jgi:hypothetical protein